MQFKEQKFTEFLQKWDILMSTVSYRASDMSKAAVKAVKNLNNLDSSFDSYVSLQLIIQENIKISHNSVRTPTQSSVFCH